MVNTRTSTNNARTFSQRRPALKRGTPALFLTFLLAAPLHAQEYGTRLGASADGEVNYEPAGPGVLFGALDPTLQHWYIPQELYQERRWRQWEFTSYATRGYERYVNTAIEGDYFYDVYGDYISHGWLVYDWRQDQPNALGSAIYKGSEFQSWFSSLTISGDAKGQNGYAVTVGNRIRTTLTPLSFSKPTFNGVQADYVADKYAATILASRISDPAASVTIEPARTANSTSLVAGRGTAQIGDFITVGATLVDARNSNTNLDLFGGNLAAGNLTEGQSKVPVTTVAVVLSDDSPEDGAAGAALFNHDVRITSRDFETGEDSEWRLDQVVRPGGRWPDVFGGLARRGYLAADGAERIVLNYDFSDPDYIGPNPTTIVAVEFDYVLANDYRIELWSDRQTGRNGPPDTPLTSEIIEAQRPALLLVDRAGGNVRDITNIRRVTFDYGLPTANMIAGVTVEGTDIWGIDLYAEWDRNLRFSQFPNAALFRANEGHEISRRTADARYVTARKQRYPLFLYGEAYAIDGDYSTSAFVVDENGDIDYDRPDLHLYEFVEDNDDQDRLPDWVRPGSQAGDTDVYPGWDQNNDFISDFNQNDNRTLRNTLPDYEEPFLRHDVDRPEFLFGIDLNNNAWIDRFEDDILPDFPYKADRRGYNAFAGLHLTPDTRLMAGRARERMLSDDRDNRTTYGLFTMDRRFGSWRLRVFDMLKRASDTIPDDRLAPSPWRNAISRPVIEDLLPAPDTWINTAWVGFDFTAASRLKIVNKLKYEIYSHVKENPTDLKGRPLTASPTLLGFVNKVEYGFSIGAVSFEPKAKLEYFRRQPFVRESLLGEVIGVDREHWMGLATLLAKFPYLERSTLTTGLELAQFVDRTVDEDGMIDAGTAGETGDVTSVNLAVQLTTNSAYQGYWLTTQIGFRLARNLAERVQADEDGLFGKRSRGTSETISFITVYAGINR